MVVKRILCPDRVRRVPRQFSWVDHSLVRDKHLCGMSNESLALYLFLVTVSDADGLSFYSDAAIARYLNQTPQRLGQSRLELCKAGFVAYSRPLYQVLSLRQSAGALPEAPCEHQQPRRGDSDLLPIGAILRQAFGGAQ